MRQEFFLHIAQTRVSESLIRLWSVRLEVTKLALKLVANDLRSNRKAKVIAVINISDFFFIITVEITQIEMLIAKYTPLRGSGAVVF